MSYLNNVRLVFSGTFQADVSTVNNDVRHFDNTTFEPRFQTLQSMTNPDGPLNGWFNPTGSGAFRLIDCSVSAVWYADGTSTTDPAQDSAVGMLIGGSSERVSGKIVDLDPQWQMASQLWGLEVRLTDVRGIPAFAGTFRPNAFRDLLFTRVGGPEGDGGASAMFQSVLEHVSWSADGTPSRLLQELPAASANGLLSIRLMTFGFVGSPRSPRYTLGTVLGVIGPCGADEPSSFVLGRRFTPAQGTASWQGINYFTGAVDEPAGCLFLDLGNALPLQDTKGTMMKIGALSVGLLLDPALTEKAPVTAQNFLSLGSIAYDKAGWLAATSGVVALPLSSAQIRQARDTPLALVTQPAGGGAAVVAMRETANGLFICAEPSVLRIDAGGQKCTTIFAAQFGKPVAGVAVNATQVGPQEGAGGSGDGNEIDPPKAPIPVMGTPEGAVILPSSAPTTGTDGRAELTVTTKAPGNPRQYMDGQVYQIQYGASGQPATAYNQFDYIVVHLRDAFDVPAHPTWDDVRPILTQFGNLYPIMSRKLFDLADLAEVKRNVHLLQLAFGLKIEDPNYMPVTRDLSDAKCRMIRVWLDQLASESADTPPQQARQQPAAPRPIAAAVAARPAEAEGEVAAPVGGKTRFARTLRATRKPYD